MCALVAFVSHIRSIICSAHGCVVGGIYTTTAAVGHCERMSVARAMLAGESALEQTMSLMPDERLAPQSLPESLGECAS